MCLELGRDVSTNGACRLGRVLMRLRCSSDLGLNHGGLIAVGLLLYSLKSLPCFTCNQEWILLATNLTATGLVVMSAVLFQPVKPAAGERLIMQVPCILCCIHLTNLALMSLSHF